MAPYDCKQNVPTVYCTVLWFLGRHRQPHPGLHHRRPPAARPPQAPRLRHPRQSRRLQVTIIVHTLLIAGTVELETKARNHGEGLY